MTDAIKAQIAAHSTNATPTRTSGHGTAERGTSAKSPGKKDHSGELTDPRMQAARREVVGVGLLAWESPVFGLPTYYRKYRLLTTEQAAELDREFYRITGTQP